jgi:hypothetical protein
MQMNKFFFVLDFDQIGFESMMFEEQFVNEMICVNMPDEMGKTTLHRACERNIYDFAHYVYPRYAGHLTANRKEDLCEQEFYNDFASFQEGKDE